jgi:hypothetical protein
MHGREVKAVPGLESLFEGDGKKYSNDALLYQDILRYPIQPTITDSSVGTVQEFKERELAKWLIFHHKEFVDYYVDSNANITISNRIEYRLPRIRDKIIDLKNFGLLKQANTVRASTVNIDIPVYSLTVSGTFLAWLLQSESTDKELSRLAKDRVFRIIESYLAQRENSRARFLLAFFGFCHLRGCFLDSYALPIDLERRVYDDFSVLEIFLDMKNIIYLVMTKWEVFHDVLTRLNEGDRRALLFQLKFQIEDYYNNQLPSKSWEKKRYDSISDYSVVTVPGYCSKCNTCVPFIYEIIEYLYEMSELARPYPSGLLFGDCPNCAEKSVSGSVMLLPSPLEMPHYYGAKPGEPSKFCNKTNDFIAITIEDVDNRRFTAHKHTTELSSV